LDGEAVYGNGGGIYQNFATITLNNSTISDNSATGSGGGLYDNNSTVNVTDSTFSGNSAQQGGGLYNNNVTVDVTNSTFSGNSATSSVGGGISSTGTLTVANSTFSGNSASVGGGISSSGTLTTLNTTFSGNNADTTGGGIYSSGSATVKNTLVVKGTTGDNCSGTLDGTANAADDGSCGASFANTSHLHLGTLGNYGGPTQTIPVLAPSDAINYGDNDTCSAAPVNGKDQRGKARDGACDMGAYEVEFNQAGPTLTVTTAADYDDNACSDADCTLREAINAANASSDANTIAFAANYTITLGSQLPAVTTAITINGNGAANTIVQASDCNPVTLPNGCTPAAYRVFEVGTTGDLTLNDLTIQNGACSGLCATDGSSGGGVYNAGTTTISNVAFIQNSANNNGGGMYNASDSSATLTNVTFSANLGAYGGGGLADYTSNPILSNVTFSGNTAGGTVNGTTYDGFGGGMYNTSSNPQLTNVVFSQNLTNTYGSGGGMYNSNSSPTLTNVSFSDNYAGAGGGMYNSNSSPALTDVLFSINSTLSRGGGIYDDTNSNPTLTNVTFSGNTAGPQGGGMYNNGSPTLINVTFSGNSANDGGGIFNGSGIPTLTNTIIANSLNGGDCSGTLNAASAYNLIEGSSCGLVNSMNGNIIGQDPMLDILADNGGFNQTHALLAGSPAIDAGDDTSCNNAGGKDQRGVLRPQGTTCDIGAFELEAYTLAITSINGTVASNPNHNFYYEGDVVQLTATPSAGWVFTNWTGGLTGTANPGSVTIHGDTAVTANYKKLASLTLYSIASNDGWVLEKGEKLNIGGSLDSTSTTFRLGDDNLKNQYRSILSFKTSRLPDNAVITSVTLKIRQQSATGSATFKMFGGLLVDIRKGTFGTSALQTKDFQTIASTPAAGIGPFILSPVGGWYTINLHAGKAYINKLATYNGLTQFRLRFKLDDNNDAIANTIRFFSGDNSTNRPMLIIQYYVP
jgi:CSLREA domain-containing protein